MMTVGERMMKDPVTAFPGDTLLTAQAKLRNGGFRQLPVVENGALVGIITDRDVRRNRQQLTITHVGSAMTRQVITVTPVTPLEVAARLLLEHKIGGLPVVQGERLVGIITITDMLQALLDLAAYPRRTAAHM